MLILLKMTLNLIILIRSTLDVNRKAFMVPKQKHAIFLNIQARQKFHKQGFIQKYKDKCKKC